MKNTFLIIYKYFLKQLYLFGGNKKNLNKYLQNFDNSLLDTRKYYLKCFKYFNKYSSLQIKEHRFYFSQNKRGYGEDAFHVMWELLYDKFNFSNFIEIGVYRGQTISLISLLASIKNRDIEVYGLSPFNNTGDEVSNYITIDFLEDTIINFKYFNLKKPHLIKHYSTDQEAHEFFQKYKWDCVYIDGSHNYDIVKQDWEIASNSVKIGGIVVFDDSSLYLNYSNPFMSFKGHVGPSKFVEDLKSKGINDFKEILIVGHNRVFKKIK
jgi:hypothetical protein